MKPLSVSTQPVNSATHWMGRISMLQVATLLLCLSAPGQTTSWTGTTSASWRTATNWNTTQVPTSASKVIISVGSFDPYIPSPSGGDTAKTGTLTVQSGSHLYFDPGGILLVYGSGSILNNGSISLGSGRMIFKSDITFSNGGVVDAGSGFIDFQGVTWDNKAGSSFQPGTSTVTFEGTSSQTITGNITLSNVEFNNVSGPVSMSGNLTVTNTMTVSSGASVTLSSGSLTLSNTATLDVEAGSTFTVNGTFNNNATVTGSGTITSSKPLIVSAIVQNSALLDITFSEPVDAASSQVLANYAVNKSVSASGATRDGSNNAVVHLTVTSLSPDTLYTVTVNNVIDATQTDTIGTNSAKSFSYSSTLPVQVRSFTANARTRSAELRWSTATEVDCYGFEIERRSMGRGEQGGWMKIGFVGGAGTSSTVREYSYHDANLAPGRYAYRIRQIDNNGMSQYCGNAEVEVGSVELKFTLESVYPNPFNPSTNIEFVLAESGPAALKVFNLLGQQVASLFNQSGEAGKLYRVRFDASQLPTGVYVARLEAEKMLAMRKLLYVR
ncbi:MAG: T9SS type A sorting domain-containing protein [Bacteroidota bacterium]